MKVYNKETYNLEGNFYRTEDWGIEVPEDFINDNFTEAVPHGLNQPVIPKQYWDENSNDWQLDEDEDQATLDAMTKLSKLAVLEAMDVLTSERTKFDMLMADDTFKERWQATTELDMLHPLTIAALAQVDFDVDAIKREIIKNS